MKLPPAPKKADPLDKITPVTDAAMLQNPPPGEWLTWRRGFRRSGVQPAEANHEIEREQSACRMDLDAFPGRE